MDGSGIIKKIEVQNSLIYKAKIFFLQIFVLSLPFEYWDPFGVSTFFTITKMVGFVYFAFAILNFRLSFRIGYQKGPLLVLLVLWLWLSLQSIIHIWPGSQFAPFNFTMLQNIILFWLISNDLINNPVVSKRLLLFLVLGVFLMNLLASLGIGLGLDTSGEEIGESRITFFGSNPNVVGNFCSMAFIIVVAMVVNKEQYFGKWTYLLLLAIPNNLLMIGLTGSRGALGIVLLGLFILFLLYKTTLVKKFFWIFIGGILSLFALQQILDSEIMQKRIEMTTEEGSLGGRDLIWNNALSIIYDNPFTGFGATGYEREMLFRFSWYRDTHNVFLYFLVTGGIVALIIYLTFLFKTFKSALFVYKRTSQSLFLVLFGIYLFAVFKGGGAINSKLLWVIITIIFSYKFSLIESGKIYQPKNIES
jgi:O-antigen ligase